jgi:hypothetical protein
MSSEAAGEREAIVILSSVTPSTDGYTQDILDECFEMFEDVGLIVDIFLIGAD